jgi:uncharacterized membrane protein
VSLDSAGTQANAGSYIPAISADGRYVAFYSAASNLVIGDTNGYSDVFVRDRQTGQTTRESVDSAGAQANSTSYYPAISADGRHIAFWSSASNLVAGDTNGKDDAFVRDRQTGQTTRVSVDSTGAQSNGHSYYTAISADGRYVAFYSDASSLVAGDTNGYADVFVRDRQTGQTTRESVDSAGTQANNGSAYPSLSADGRYVAFRSSASDLVAGDTNGKDDVFVRDRQSGQTTRVSVDSAGTQGNNGSYNTAISADGRVVAFYSSATTLVAGDSNGKDDVFVHEQWPLNTAPTANAGPDQALDQTSPAGADATLDGSASSDADGDPLTYLWTWLDGAGTPQQSTAVKPVVSLPVGTTVITLVVNDGTVDSAPDTVSVTVRHTLAPQITGWTSLAGHGTAGEIGLAMADLGVEPRKEGLSKIQISFTEALDPATVSPAVISVVGTKSGDVSGLVTGATLNPAGGVLTVVLTPPADVDWYTFTVSAAVKCLAGGVPLAGDRDRVLGALKGDANRQRVVDIGDVTAVQANVGKAVTLSTARCDVNRDGRINIGDVTMVQANRGHRLP